MTEKKDNKSNYRMIDVSEKNVSKRTATAVGSIRVCEKTLQMIRSGQSPKGNILAIAEVAGIMAAKNTPSLLPLCHPLIIDAVKVWFEIENDIVKGFCQVTCNAKTGVEMEALVGVNAALLTVYDLAKAVDPVIEISNIYLMEKIGGKSGHWTHPKLQQPNTLNNSLNSFNLVQKSVQNSSVKITQGINHGTYGVITLSDRASQGVYEDESGKVLEDFAKNLFLDEGEYIVLPDDAELLKKKMNQLSQKKTPLILITGGTGIGPKDITLEVIRSLAAKELPGFGEKQRLYGEQFTKSSWLSRSSAFVVDSSLVVLFPGSPKAVKQGLEAIGDLIPHALKMLQGDGHD